MPEPLVRGLTSSLDQFTLPPHRRAGFSSAVSRGLQRISLWMARRRQRKALAELSEHFLNDIGVSREEALREAARRFWQ